jgi:O-succinylbenzoate synthase
LVLLKSDSMRIEKIELYALRVPMRVPFEASFGGWRERETTLVCVKGEGVVGYAESVALPGTFYSEETPSSVWEMVARNASRFIGIECDHPCVVTEMWPPQNGSRMAVAALEGAVWDWYCRCQGISLAQALGGIRREVEAGVSIGMAESIESVLTRVRAAVGEGYRRVKVKIKPGFDEALIAEIRREWKDLPLMVDANSVYTLEDVTLLKRLDAYHLLMIEQPFAATDLAGHARLQEQIATPLCLDEGIASLADAKKALELGSCQVINLKPGRVGGLSEAKAIHDLCVQENIPVWCGGMLELGIGRSHNIALASLAGFSIAGDLSPPLRTYAEDIVQPEVKFHRPGWLPVPCEPGIGVLPDFSVVDKYTVQRLVL